MTEEWWWGQIGIDIFIYFNFSYLTDRSHFDCNIGMKHRVGHIPNNQAHNRAKNTLRMCGFSILCYCFVFNTKAASSEKVTQRTRCQPTIGQKGNKIHMLAQGPFLPTHLHSASTLDWFGVQANLWAAFVFDEKLCIPRVCLIQSICAEGKTEGWRGGREG